MLTCNKQIQTVEWHQMDDIRSKNQLISGRFLAEKSDDLNRFTKMISIRISSSPNGHPVSRREHH